jgi:hypothetical protein
LIARIGLLPLRELVWMITNLEASTYVKIAESHALLDMTAGVLSQFVITDQQIKQTAWLRNVREWAQVHMTENKQPLAYSGKANT